MGGTAEHKHQSISLSEGESRSFIMASPDAKARVVLGAQWGDEGKGKVIDLLADQVDIVCRCQGGNNAGHTVVVGESKFDLHLLPSGVINENCTAVLGNGVVISLPQLFDEIACNEAKGLKSLKNRLLISNKAHLVFDFHQAVDGLQEKEKGTKSLGTTKKGIGPTYSCKVSRGGIPLSDLLYDFSEFEEKFRDLVRNYLKQFTDLNIDVEEELERYRRYAEEIRGCVTNTVTFLHQSIKKGKSILIEGANGTMLDIDFGTYPYVTSSNSTVGGVITGLGIPPRSIGDVYGVAKAYCTRVGDGPFPTEQNNEIGTILQERGAEIGVTTKRKRRCGWLDMVLLSYSNMINGYTHLAITKLDVLDSFDQVKIGIEYQLDGKTLTEPPANAKALDRVTVNYLTLPGWKENTRNCRNFSDLPAEAQNYILKIEELCGVSVRWIGVGPERSSIIQRF